MSEHGSAMHSVVVSCPGTVVACLGMANPLQARIGDLRGHRNLFLHHLGARWDESGPWHANPSRPDLHPLAAQGTVRGIHATAPQAAGDTPP